MTRLSESQINRAAAKAMQYGRGVWIWTAPGSRRLHMTLAVPSRRWATIIALMADDLQYWEYQL